VFFSVDFAKYFIVIFEYFVLDCLGERHGNPLLGGQISNI